jgi:hypothetical protein
MMHQAIVCQSSSPFGPAFVLARYIRKFRASAAPQTLPRPLDSLEEPRIVLETVFEPIFIAGEADQDTRRLAVPCNHELVLFREPQVFG